MNRAQIKRKEREARRVESAAALRYQLLGESASFLQTLNKNAVKVAILKKAKP